MEELKTLAMGIGIKGRVKAIPFPIETIERIEKIGKVYSNPASRFLFYWLYLTGQRVGEAIRLRKANINIKEKDGQEFIVVDSITEKNRYNPRRSIPIPYRLGKESWMSRCVWDYIEKIDPKNPIIARFGDDGELIPLSRTNVWNYLNRVKVKILAIRPEDRSIFQTRINIFPHYQRHCRATHMVSYYNYDMVKLMQMFGWESPSMPMLYVSLAWGKLAEVFLK